MSTTAARPLHHDVVGDVEDRQPPAIGDLITHEGALARMRARRPSKPRPSPSPSPSYRPASVRSSHNRRWRTRSGRRLRRRRFPRVSHSSRQRRCVRFFVHHQTILVQQEFAAVRAGPLLIRAAVCHGCRCFMDAGVSGAPRVGAVRVRSAQSTPRVASRAVRARVVLGNITCGAGTPHVEGPHLRGRDTMLRDPTFGAGAPHGEGPHLRATDASC